MEKVLHRKACLREDSSRVFLALESVVEASRKVNDAGVPRNGEDVM